MLLLSGGQTGPSGVAERGHANVSLGCRRRLAAFKQKYSCLDVLMRCLRRSRMPHKVSRPAPSVVTVAASFTPSAGVWCSAAVQAGAQLGSSAYEGGRASAKCASDD
ncbi:hypothetical protein CVIRNUC_007550 [Coccomyxa viridis]|uniref:Uncharacterized protein n=1 Tax=Coccomyxa viridis TaxID=1274662 RepID=A0AAV1IBW7_9CHLO|nr:hypothetical protein CVIRNUC_007550 [Coccomyxa viridis]